VSLELSEYAAANARLRRNHWPVPEDASCRANGRFRGPAAGNRIAPHHARGRVRVGLPERRAVGQYQLPQDDGRAVIRSWMDETESDVAQGKNTLAATVLRAAQRSDVPMLVTGKDEYVLGEASTGDGGIVDRGSAPSGRAKCYGSGHFAPAPATTRRCIARAIASAALTCCCCFS